MPRIRSRNVLPWPVVCSPGRRRPGPVRGQGRLQESRAAPRALSRRPASSSPPRAPTAWSGRRTSRATERQGGPASTTPQKIKTALFGTVAEPDKMYMIDDANRTYSVWDSRRCARELRPAEGDLHGPEARHRHGRRTSPARSAADVVQGQRLRRLRREGVLESRATGSRPRAPPEGERDVGRRAARDGLDGLARPLRDPREGSDRAHRHDGARRGRARGRLGGALRGAGGLQGDRVRDGRPHSRAGEGRLRRARPMREALDRMTPEQRKQYEDAMKRHAVGPDAGAVSVRRRRTNLPLSPRRGRPRRARAADRPRSPPPRRSHPAGGTRARPSSSTPPTAATSSA